MTVSFFDPAATGAAVDPQDPQPVDDEAGPIDSDQLIAWVHTTVLPIYQRSPTKLVWCPQWWEHAEAIYRFEVVRRAWEQAVVSDDGEALSNWTLHHLDPHMVTLTAPNGPFSECGWTQRHGYKTQHDPQPLPAFEPTDTTNAA